MNKFHQEGIKLVARFKAERKVEFDYLLTARNWTETDITAKVLHQHAENLRSNDKAKEKLAKKSEEEEEDQSKLTNQTEQNPTNTAESKEPAEPKGDQTEKNPTSTVESKEPKVSDPVEGMSPHQSSELRRKLSDLKAKDIQEIFENLGHAQMRVESTRKAEAIEEALAHFKEGSGWFSTQLEMDEVYARLFKHF
jgi:hypothetical protein